MDDKNELDQLRSQLEQSGERLRSSEGRIRTLIKTIPVGLVITDFRGNIQSASPAALELFRCSYADFHSRNLRDLFSLSEQETQPLTEITSAEPREMFAIRPDGSKFPASVRVSSFASSSVPGLLVVIEDVSAKHELEKLRQEFLSMMAHDMRTPLSSVKCFLELIAAGIYDDKQDDLKQRSTGVIDSTSRLINMINSLLDLHKLESGRLNLHLEPVRVGDIINQSMESLDALAESRGIPLDVEPFPSNLHVHADLDYTVQVLVNLLSNALKFSEEGSPVTVLVELSGEVVKFTVSDKGRGIPREIQSRLFNRFEQARMSDARVLGGSGLGLAISRAIVEEQGGEIGVESEPGKGCDFWFTLKKSSG